MNSFEHTVKFREVIKHFNPDFKEMYRNDAAAHVVVDALVAGVDPYQLIEQLLKTNINLTRTIHRLMQMHPVPWDWTDAMERAHADIRKTQLGKDETISGDS